MEVPQGDTYYILFTTRQFSTGAPFTLTAATVSVYEEGTATPIQTLVAVTEDYNTVTGLNMVPVVASSGNGYDVGSYYSVVIDAGTVDSISAVGEVVGHFRVIPTEGIAGVKDVNVTHVSDVAEDLPTATELAKVPKSDGTSSWNATALAAIQTEANDAIVANHLDHLFNTTYDPASIPGVADALLNELTENDAGVARFTTNALENAPGGTPSQPLLQSTTILAYTSNTSFTLTTASADNDAYNGQMIVITDQVTGTQKAVGLIIDYIGASKTVTLDADPGVFTYANGDTVEIWAVSGSNVPLEIDTNGRVDVGSVGGTAQTSGDLAGLITTVDGVVDTIEADLANGTDGLGAIKGAVDTAQADLNTITGTDGVTLATAQALYAPATATALGTAQTDLDTITGSDGVTLATAQALYAPATAASLATTDGKVDGIKAKTDDMTYTKALELDVNTQSINGAAVVGDGNATPWDGA